MKFGFLSGCRKYGPLFGQFRIPGIAKVLESEVLGWCVRARPYIFSDFEGNALGGAWLGATVQTAGAPVAAIDQTVANGTVKLLLTANNENQSARLTLNDKGPIPASKRPQGTFLVRIDALPAAGERVRIGFASAHNDTLNSVARCAWFALEGDGILKAEATDGTNATRLQVSSPQLTLVVGQWYEFNIDMKDPNNIVFYVDGSSVAQIAAPLMDATLLQPYVIVQKTATVGVPGAHVDYIHSSWDRA